ncbi:MAG: hypothetical protein ACTTKL_09955 [Treponema sp.]
MKKKIIMALLVMVTVVGMGFAGECKEHNTTFYGNECPVCAKEKANALEQKQKQCTEWDKARKKKTKARDEAQNNYDAFCD